MKRRARTYAGQKRGLESSECLQMRIEYSAGGIMPDEISDATRSWSWTHAFLH